MSVPAPASWRAPNGLDIRHYNKTETQFVYQEVFVDRVYVKHGISLSDDAVVLDVGANIGLFAMFVGETCAGGRVVAVEPGPPTFALLTANTERYGPRVTRLQCGASSHELEATFTHYPGYSIMSGFQPDAARDTQTLTAGIRNQWHDKFPNRAIDEKLVEHMVRAALDKQENYVCRLRPVSALIAEAGLERIDLLKIDTEGSEADVLAGIAAADWPRIAQVVIEIHDATGTLTPQILWTLQSKGFQCVVEEEATLRGSGIANCYGRRR